MRAAAPAAWETSLQTSESWPKRAGAQHREQQELRQLAAGHAARDHVLGAEPQHQDDAGERQEHRGDGDDGARLGHRARGLIGGVGGGAIARGGKAFRDEGLHHAHRREALGGEGGRVGERILGEARARAAPRGRPRRAAAR